MDLRTRLIERLEAEHRQQSELAPRNEAAELRHDQARERSDLLAGLEQVARHDHGLRVLESVIELLECDALSARSVDP